jgi:hypothetical protein
LDAGKNMLARWISIYVFGILTIVLGSAVGMLHSERKESMREITALRKDVETARKSVQAQSDVVETAEKALAELRARLSKEGTARASAEAALPELQRALDDLRRAKADADIALNKAKQALEEETRLRVAAETQAEQARNEVAALKKGSPALANTKNTQEVPGNGPLSVGSVKPGDATQATSGAFKPAAGTIETGSIEKTRGVAGEPQAKPAEEKKAEPSAEKKAEVIEEPRKEKPKPAAPQKKPVPKPQGETSSTLGGWMFGQ